MNDWNDFKSRCPVIDCENPDNHVHLSHKASEEHEKIKAYGEIYCLKDIRGQKCLVPSFILELSFKCGYGAHIDYISVDGDKALDEN